MHNGDTIPFPQRLYALSPYHLLECLQHSYSPLHSRYALYAIYLHGHIFHKPEGQAEERCPKAPVEQMSAV